MGEKNTGRIPKHVLNLLNEHAVGGFMLFYFNSKSGEPEHVMSFDSPAHCLALQKYMQDWTEALHNSNIQNAQDVIEDMRNPPQEEDGEGTT
jgi:hypothetical protein